MRSALYYPHTEFPEQGSEALLKRALLMWDNVEFVVPDPNYTPSYEDKVIAEAIEIIGRKHPPTEREKRAVHEEVEELVTRPNLPEVFKYSSSSNDPYEVYPQKLDERTWTVLADAGFAGRYLTSSSDYPLTPAMGLTLMSILADKCAGETAARITDLPLAYANIAGLLQGTSGNDSESQPDEIRERVVAVTLNLLNLENVSLASLIDLRRREAKESGHSLEDLRHGYVDRIETFLTLLSANAAYTDTDITRLEEEFAREMSSDLARLKDELRLQVADVLTSKELVAIVLTAAAGAVSALLGVPWLVTGVVTASNAPMVIGGILNNWGKSQKMRAEIMRKHPMAYLYEARGGIRI
jgi:hypothetical protein